MARKAAGSGSIRKRTRIKDGREYSYWEARYTEGYDPETGKQVQRTITGKTQREVSQKLLEATSAIQQGTYLAPSKVTVGEWLDTWLADYLVAVKPRTADSYRAVVDKHLKPAFDQLRLQELTPIHIQRLYNKLLPDYSAKTIRNINGILHRALQQAIEVDLLRRNPATMCKLPRVERKTIVPLDGEAISSFLTTIKGHPYETLYIVTLFTGMREGEVLGLTWDCIDFKNGTININKQLQKERRGTGAYHLVSPKNGKSRRITPAPTVMQVLRELYRKQAEQSIELGEAWEDSGLVFTNEIGHHLSAQTVYLHFKKLIAKAGYPNTRFHDLRHSYAVAALQSGDDIKTVQENLGHHTAAFTLDVYGHVTEQMKRESASRMDKYIKSVHKPVRVL